MENNKSQITTKGSTNDGGNDRTTTETNVSSETSNSAKENVNQPVTPPSPEEITPGTRPPSQRSIPKTPLDHESQSKGSTSIQENEKKAPSTPSQQDPSQPLLKSNKLESDTPLTCQSRGLESKIVGKEDIIDGVGSSESTNSSGIGSGLSGKSSETNSDTISVSSGGTVQPSGSKVLSLCQRGEWMIVDQILRTIQKSHIDLSQADEVCIS